MSRAGATGLPTAPPEAPSTWRRTAGWILGVLLLAAAGWALARGGEAVPQAWSSIRTASPWLLGAALALPLLNLLIVSLSFWILMRREGRVGPGEMLCVIGAAWLLNFAPLRPGLVGRIAYHRAVNGIPLARAALVTVIGIVAGAAAVLLTLGIAVLVGPKASPLAWAMWLGLMVLVTAGATAALAALGSPAWVFSATLGLRTLDVLVWVARYAVLFALIGSPITLPGAVAVAAVCQATLIVPFIGNGLGIREWAVALTAAALPAGLFAASGSAKAAGLSADLVNRAAELVIAVPLGLACSAWLAHRVRRSATPPGPGAQPA